MYPILGNTIRQGGRVPFLTKHTKTMNKESDVTRPNDRLKKALNDQNPHLQFSKRCIGKTTFGTLDPTTDEYEVTTTTEYALHMKNMKTGQERIFHARKNLKPHEKMDFEGKSWCPSKVLVKNMKSICDNVSCVREKDDHFLLWDIDEWNGEYVPTLKEGDSYKLMK